jgi:hypothetical protein
MSNACLFIDPFQFIVLGLLAGLLLEDCTTFRVGSVKAICEKQVCEGEQQQNYVGSEGLIY